MDKTKHGLRKYHFWLVKVRVYGGRREEEEEKRRRRREKKKKKSWYEMFGTFVWNNLLELFRTCMEFMFGLGIFQTKFFVYM